MRPSPRDRVRPELASFSAVLAQPITPGALAPLRAADAAGASAEARARSYLHANCSMCHCEGSGAGAATLDLRIDKAFADTRTCNVAPQAGDLAVPGLELVAPGDPARSAVAQRMRAQGATRMPTLATHVIDDVGVAAVEAWIASLPLTCP